MGKAVEVFLKLRERMKGASTNFPALSMDMRDAKEEARIMNKFPRGAFVTSDGVQLSYIRQGGGRPIVLIHGWSQCAEESNIRSSHSARDMTSSPSKERM